MTLTNDYSPLQVNKVAQNTVSLLGGQIAVQVSGMILGILIARTLGDTAYGQYSLAFAFVGIFSLLFTMGVDYLVVRDIAQTRDTSAAVVGAAFWLRLAGFPLVLIITTIAAWLLGYRQEQRYLILLASIALGLTAAADLPRSLFRGLQQMHLDAGNRVIEKVCALGLGALGLWLTRSLDTAIIAMIVGALVALLLGGMITKRLLGRINPGSPRNSTALLKRSAPLAASLAIITAYTYLPAVFLSRIRNVHEVGLYSAAYNIVLPLSFIPLALGAALLPVLSVLASSKSEQFNRTHATILSYMLILSLPIAAGLMVFGKDLIQLLYGSSFLAATPALMILALSIPLVFWSLYLNTLLIAVGDQHLVLIGSVIYLVATVIASAFLVPMFGFIGTAISYVLVYGVALALLLYFTSRWVTHRLERKVLGAVIGTALMVIGVFAAGAMALWIRIPLAIGLYALGFLATSGMKIDELKDVFKVLFISRSDHGRPTED